MYSEMGLWYLHAFWKFVAQVMNADTGLPLMKRESLWEAWWLTSFLLEGQAMYAQLHLIPSSHLEISCPQFDFIQAIGLDAWKINAESPQSISRGTHSLFIDACAACHSQGLKEALLLSESDTLRPYLLG